MRVQQLVAVLALASTARVATTVFKPDAAEKVTWQFKQRPKEDVARVEVQFRLSPRSGWVGRLGWRLRPGRGSFCQLEKGS